MDIFIKKMKTLGVYFASLRKFELLSAHGYSAMCMSIYIIRLCQYQSNERDTFLNGVAFDLSFRQKLPNVFGESEKHPASPLVFFLNDEGKITVASLIWKKLAKDHPRFNQIPLPQIFPTKETKSGELSEGKENINRNESDFKKSLQTDDIQESKISQEENEENDKFKDPVVGKKGNQVGFAEKVDVDNEIQVDLESEAKEFQKDVMELIHECLDTKKEDQDENVIASKQFSPVSSETNSKVPESSKEERLSFSNEEKPRITGSYLETPEQAIAAVTKNGMLLEQVSPRLRNNKIIVLAALENSLESVVFVGEDLKNDVDIIKFFRGECQKKASELASRRKKMTKNYDESFKMFTEISQVVEKSKGELENNAEELTKLTNRQFEYQQNLLSIQEKKLDYFSQELDKEREKTKVGLIESIDFTKITNKERVKSIAVWIDKRIGVLENVRELALERERELDSLCTICKEKKNGIVFSCGHQACLVCGQNESLQKCPSCLKPITNRIALL